MVQWILRGIAALAFLAFLAFLLVAGVAGYFWHLGNEAMDRAEKSGWFEVEHADAPLTVFESMVQQAYFRDGWNERVFPCRTVMAIWASFTNSRQRRLGGEVSQMLANKITYAEFEPSYSLSSHLRRASLSCHLEGRFRDAMLLRVDLKRAIYGPELIGTDATALTLFGKSASDLDNDESLRLATLYWFRGINRKPEDWDKMTERLRKRLQERATTSP
jgi:hypothetical protein